MPRANYPSIKSGNYKRHKIDYIYSIFKIKFNPSNSSIFKLDGEDFKYFSLACNLYKTINPNFNGLSVWGIKEAILLLERKFSPNEVSKIEINDIYEVLKVPSYDFMKCVIVDPGHGGKDPGAEWDNTHTEHMVVSDIANKLKEQILLDASTNFIPLISLEIMYPNGVPINVRPSLSKRIITPRKYATDRELENEFFISLHCNASTNKNARGLSVHYRVGYPDMRNKEYAQIIYDELIKKVPELKGNRSSPLVDEGKRLTVLNTAFSYTLPAVLVEISFISNEQDKKLLFDPEVIKRIVIGFYNGIKRIVFN